MVQYKKQGRGAVRKAHQPPGRPKDAAKKAAIVRAATALFMKHGFEMTSMEAVAKKADVSKLTIYSHFADKQELFKAVIRQRCDQQAMPECFMALAGQSAREGLLQLGKRLASLILSPDSLRLHRIMQMEAARYPQIVAIFYEAGPRRVRQAFGELLEEWNRQGKLSVRNVPQATEQFFSLIKGELHLKAMMLLAPDLSAEAVDAHIEAAVNLFLAGYQPKTKADAP